CARSCSSNYCSSWYFDIW
nr:immunoglobulin heavy chain junction region [Macaca mulatta]MOW46566.1 immunoglobulin heavy chain junction region [Macaca mulatta]MOW48508.1 immunoglobulin heavy chain junction region [Macaca mulatta]MOW48798.1 immunoglobulin heavy chain junction region [Macaca mulatta]